MRYFVADTLVPVLASLREVLITSIRLLETHHVDDRPPKLTKITHIGLSHDVVALTLTLCVFL